MPGARVVTRALPGLGHEWPKVKQVMFELSGVLLEALGRPYAKGEARDHPTPHFLPSYPGPLKPMPLGIPKRAPTARRKDCLLYTSPSPRD